jgi:nucleoside-diphosphate-sugar epimerase
MQPQAPADEAELNSLLSVPDDSTIQAIASVDGDIAILGAGGKMGPTLAIMARRALDQASNGAGGNRKVFAVSRFSDANTARELESRDVEVIRADLSDASQIRALPPFGNVLWLVGQKFGTSGDPAGTWQQNVIAAMHAAERFDRSRIVCFSTGNVYAGTPVSSGGSRETDALAPIGEYAASCVGRERVFESFMRRSGAPLLLFRLFYACDLRYGVVTDIAHSILNGKPISLENGFANVIWQGDASRLALRALTIADAPPRALNVTGPIVSVRDIAVRSGKLLGKVPVFTGIESSEALLANIESLNRLLPHESLPLDTLLEWTASWISRGGRLLGKPTKFEVADGKF